jgi:hypothetical protein
LPLGLHGSLTGELHGSLTGEKARDERGFQVGASRAPPTSQVPPTSARLHAGSTWRHREGGSAVRSLAFVFVALASGCSASNHPSEGDGLAPCNGAGECDEYSTCSDGLCEHLCDATPDGGPQGCPTNWSCLPMSATDATAGDLTVCVPHCNPLLPFTSDATHQGCGSNQRCDATSTVNATFCDQPAGTGSLGASCQSSDDCVAGYACAASHGTCQPYCRVADVPSDCTAPLVCNAFMNELYDGTEEIGVCLAP